MAPPPSSYETAPLLRDEHNVDGEEYDGARPESPPTSGSAMCTDSLSTTRIVIAVGLTWFGSFLAALDSTITTTLSATIAHDLGTLTIISWLGSAYLIALTIIQPLSGKLTDIFGRRAGLLACARSGDGMGSQLLELRS